jgi:hypothetical protein
VYPDPAAGLGGSRATGFRATRAGRTKIEIAQPVEPDPEADREAMRAALAEEKPAPNQQRQPGPRGRPSSGRQRSSHQVQRKAGDRPQEPTVATATGKPKRRQNLGCVVTLVIVLIIVVVNVFSGLGGWLDGVFHP